MTDEEYSQSFAKLREELREWFKAEYLHWPTLMTDGGALFRMLHATAFIDVAAELMDADMSEDLFVGIALKSFQTSRARIRTVQ
jgi:hypothetical protein